MRTGNSLAKFSIVALAFFSAALLAMAVGCGEGDFTTGSSELRAPASGGSGNQLGVTSPVRFATTSPPPPPPSPSPGPVPVPPPDDGKVRIHGILLAYDTTCPDCALVTRRGSVFVPADAELFGSTAHDEFPITFAELNAALQIGVPLRITADDVGGAVPVADNVRLEYWFATTGDIHASSSEVIAQGGFTLGLFTGELGHIEITYVLADDALVEEPFDEFDRVYVTGVVKNGVLKVKFVRRDE